jgi:uncharacterized protein with GYD domain
MPKYAIFFRLSSGAIAGSMDTPTNREEVVERLCQEAGGHLESYYWMFGDYDGFAVVEVPDSRAAAAISLTVSSTGACNSVSTHELISGAELNDRLAEAKRLSAVYTAPGARPR